MPSNNAGKTSPGSHFKPPPAVIWNNMVDAGRAWADGQLNNGAPPPNRPRETDLIKIKNGCGADRAKGEILLISDKALTDLTDENIWLLGDAPTADGYFAILKEPIQIDDVGTAQVSGCCLAMVDVSSTSHTRAKAAAGLYVLESSDEGPLEILYSPGTTGEVECVVRFGGGGGGGAIFGFRTTSVVSSSVSTGSIYPLSQTAFASPSETGQTIIASILFGSLPVGTLGYCSKSGSNYYVIQAGCVPEEEYL